MAIIESEEESKQSKQTRKRRRILGDHAGPSRKQTEAEEDENVRKCRALSPFVYEHSRIIVDAKGHYLFKAGRNLTARYEINTFLGQGGFGWVLECWDRKTKDHVDIKVVRSNIKYRDEAKTEVNVLELLAQKDTCKLQYMRNFFSCRKHPCIVFEKLGPSLRDFLEKNDNCPLPMDLIREFAHQLLEYMHDLGLIHTDVKPENVLLVSSEEKFSGETNLRFLPKSNAIKLIDFCSTEFDNLNPSSNCIVTTRPYRAPEVILVLGWSFPCDIWSIGCTLAELCLGEPLFKLPSDDMEHLLLMWMVFGPLPEHMMPIADDFFKAISLERKKLLESWTLYSSYRTSYHSMADPPAPAPLLICCVLLDPSERLTAQKALDHQFFKDQT